MKKARFTEEQMVKIPREADKATVAEVARKHGARPGQDRDRLQRPGQALAPPPRQKGYQRDTTLGNRYFGSLAGTVLSRRIW